TASFRDSRSFPSRIRSVMRVEFEKFTSGTMRARYCAVKFGNIEADLEYLAACGHAAEADSANTAATIACILPIERAALFQPCAGFIQTYDTCSGPTGVKSR